MNSFTDVLTEAQRIGPKKIAIAGPPNEELTEALGLAGEMGICEPVIFDDALSAVAATRSGETDVLMKSSVSTKDFMKAVLDKDHGLRKGRLISHVFIFEAFGRLLMVTDGGICIRPTLEEKAEIIKNIIPIAHRLGIETPKVAVLTAIEKVNPKMPETVDAAKLAEMTIPGCLVQGPLAVDNAVSPEAAETKGIPGPVAGHADVLLVSSVEVGNIFAKGIVYFSSCPVGGVVGGTSRSVTLLSRSDTTATKLNTLALGVLMSEP
ncbi:hypothetical protein LCGC14_0019040 [marine sediment metagenome]|uniref:Phosphate acetyl/butaryl transferase domain-containing protein n=1 Tax=marine sediment metagenome TaxID=412755 RepID=A0A0F9WG50_9ZZZZ|nr:phosphate butyryltransferase [Phycisphaerae bacterium]